MKAVIYARSATRTKSRHDNTTEMQIKICTKYAIENGYKVVRVFIDAGYPGTRLNRPGLTAMRYLVCRLEISTVIVTDLARLARTANGLSLLRREFTEKKVQILWVRT